MVDPSSIALGFMLLMLAGMLSFTIASLTASSDMKLMWEGDRELREQMWEGDGELREQAWKKNGELREMIRAQDRETREELRSGDRELHKEMWKLREQMQDLQRENQKLITDLNAATTRRVDALEGRLDRIATRSHS